MASTQTVETAKKDVRRSLQCVGEGALSRAAWALPVLLVNLKPPGSRKVVSDEQGLGSHLSMSVGLWILPFSHPVRSSSVLPMCQALCLHQALAVNNERPQPSVSLSSGGRRELMLYATDDIT